MRGAEKKKTDMRQNKGAGDAACLLLQLLTASLSGVTPSVVTAALNNSLAATRRGRRHHQAREAPGDGGSSTLARGRCLLYSAAGISPSPCTRTASHLRGQCEGTLGVICLVCPTPNVSAQKQARVTGSGVYLLAPPQLASLEAAVEVALNLVKFD